MGDIRKLGAEIKSDDALAIALWDTGNIDARFLAIGWCGRPTSRNSPTG